MITKEIALNLKYRDILQHISVKNTDKTPLRCRVNGKCKVWVTRPEDFELPVIHGFRDYFIITPENAHLWTLTNESTNEETS